MFFAQQRGENFAWSQENIAENGLDLNADDAFDADLRFFTSNDLGGYRWEHAMFITGYDMVLSYN